MTPPGDPRNIFDQNRGFSRPLAHYVAEGFVSLESELDAVVHNGHPREVRALWRKRQSSGHLLRIVATVESRSSGGKTAVFELLFVASNDNRHYIPPDLRDLLQG